MVEVFPHIMHSVLFANAILRRKFIINKQVNANNKVNNKQKQKLTIVVF